MWIQVNAGIEKRLGQAVIFRSSAAAGEYAATGTPIANVRVWIQDVPKENWGIAGVSAKDLGR